MRHLLCLLFSSFLFTLSAQTIKVEPYLQDAEPDRITIMWETDTGEESTVEWGLTDALGNTTTGIFFAGNGGSQMHEATLENLERFTVYHYRVKTGTATSAIYSFKTPPFSADNQSFRIAAMSDMQRDNANPNKFNEVVQDGILSYLNTIGGGNLHDDLSLVMIPGDLVVNGLVYSQWEEHFFDPAHPLFAQIPVYPVPGNHENDSDFYFNYFHLPDNGTAGFEEHWWYKDYSNIRIIGLDSNTPYRTQQQLDWLVATLDEVCKNEDIDFVFAELHHPHKSELWTPGNTDFTGEVITRLEDFTTNCGKPSIHFFGHTHGYSRGQSRDHDHLWVNVATAGGAIDNWDEFPQQDYEEFSVSQDDWGFVIVEVNAADDPGFTLKRISRGNETTFRNNEETDLIQIRLNNLMPENPTPVYPVDIEIASSCVLLEASEFIDMDGEHGAAHWQVSTNCEDFSNLVFESWKQHENWYRDEDLQAEDDLTNEEVTSLEANTTYCWRVRYRDQNLGWSEWSSTASFFVTEIPDAMSFSTLVNPGAEELSTPWTIEEGIFEILTDGECDGISPNTGEHYYAVGGVCEDGPYARVSQTVNIEPFFMSIEENDLMIHYGGYLSDFNGSDIPAMKLLLLDENDVAQDSTQTLSTQNSSWTLLEEWVEIPSWCHRIQFVLTGTRNAGSDNDSYFDDLFLNLETAVPCAEPDFISNFSAQESPISVYPNPAVSVITLELPNQWFGTKMEIVLNNTLGQTVKTWNNRAQKRQQLNLENFANGSYILQVYIDNELVDAKHIIVLK